MSNEHKAIEYALKIAVEANANSIALMQAVSKAGIQLDADFIEKKKNEIVRGFNDAIEKELNK